MNGFIICPMTEADLEAVLAIESTSFPQPWTQDHFLQELHSPNSFPLVAISTEGKLLGYICPMLVLDEGHILDVAVDPSARGYGLGTFLVERVLKDCRERGAEFVSLEVRPSNRSAISLYSRLGFIETGRRRRYYRDGEDALLMEYIFSSQEEEDNAV